MRYRAMNVCAGLLAYRIWIIQRGVSGVNNTSRNTVMPVVRVLVDAAILYSAALLTALILFVSGNNGQDAVVDMVSRPLTLFIEIH